MKVVDIANQIYLENGSPTDTSIASIAYWIRSNIGKLNTLLYERFWVDTQTLEIVSETQTWSGQPTGSQDGTFEINSLASNILVMMYKVYRLELDIRKNMAAMQADLVIAANDEEFSVKRINRNEILKALASFKKDTLKELYDLVHGYRSYNGGPTQVTGDDTEAGHYGGIPNAFTRNILGSQPGV